MRYGDDPKHNQWIRIATQIREEIVARKCAELGIKRKALDALATFALGDEGFGIDKADNILRVHFALAALELIERERERCAKIAENYRPNHSEERQERLGLAEGIGRAALVHSIAAEIRKGV